MVAQTRTARTPALDFLKQSDRREQIYFHAARLFLEKGFAATSMSEIADAVGITKAAVYHFVSNKEELLINLMTWGMDVLDADVTFPARRIGDPLARLHFIVVNHVQNIGRTNTAAGNPLTIIVDEPAGLSAENRAEILLRKRRYFQLVQDTVKELHQQNKLISVDPTVAAFSVLGMVLWFARWHRPNGRLSVDQLSAQIAEMALRAVIRPEVLARSAVLSAAT